MVIQKNASNEIAISLQESVTLTDPYFLFVFTSESTNVSYAVILTDTSVIGAARDRSNLFTLIEGVNNPTSGSVILGYPGRYTYAVYEQTSSTNLNPDNALLLSNKRGLARVIGVSEASDFVEHQITTEYVERNVA